MATSRIHGQTSALDILIVDGDDASRERIECLLARTGLRALSVGTLALARKAMRAAYFPLVILDRDLGRADGRDLCGEYRARHFGRRVRILMLETPGPNRAPVSALAAGADDSLDKSAPDAELLARIMRLHAIACGPPPPASTIDAEAARVRALHEFDILETPPERAFDDIARIAQVVCDAPIALVSFVDECRQWFKAKIGLEVSEVPREQAFTTYAIQGTDVFVVNDATLDPRFADSPLVRGRPGLRFYAGAPLITSDGAALGAVCVIDRRARELDDNGRETLVALARQAMGLLEHRRERSRLQAALVADHASTADLARTQAVFRSAFENAPIGMAMVSIHGEWLRVNRALCEIVGYSEEELLRTNFQSVTHPDDLRADLDHAANMLEGRTVRYEVEKRYIHRRGHVVWVTLHVSLVRDQRERPLYFISQIQDITSRKELERARTEFVAVVSHELRTPITSIRGSLGLLAANAAGELPPKARHLVDLADRNAQRLHRLIDDILDLEKMESGAFRYEHDLFEVDDFVARALEVMKPYADQFGVELRLVSPPLSTRIKADEKRIQQVVTNLISNAVKFSPRGSAVEIALSRVELRVRFAVTDHGSGIPAEYHDTLFRKFAQAPSMAVAPVSGTGLGLSICKSIVEAHDGRIGFETNAAEGTTFWFEVPVIDAR